MIAYKFLAPGAVAPFTRFRWPRGDWVRAPEGAGDDRWIHACRIADLPYWLGPELWRLELAAPLVSRTYQVASPAGRLVERIAGWNAAAAADFARDCAERAREVAAAGPRPGADAETLEAFVSTAEAGAAGRAAVSGFALEMLARALGGEPAAGAERARQARWLAERLALRES